MKKIIIFMFISMLLLIFYGCQDIVQTKPDSLVWQVNLNMDDITIYHPVDLSAERYKMSLTLTNSGNQKMEDMVIGLITENPFDFTLDKTGITGLEPDESETFTVTFPSRELPLVFEAQLIVGNKTAATRINLRYGIFELINDPLVAIQPSLLQRGKTSSFTFSTEAEDNELGIWVYNSGFAKEGDQIPVLSGEDDVNFIGFLVSESPFRVKGKKFTVYPATENIALNYSGGSTIIRSNSGTAAPLNASEIQRAALEAGGAVNYSFTGGAGVISGIHPTSGELTFSATAANDTSASVTVDVNITKSVPEGTLVMFHGSSSFIAKIGIAPAPILHEAGTVNTTVMLQTFRIDLIFDQTINAGDKDPKDGFTITKASKGAAPAAVLGIQQAVIVGNVIQFTLNAASPVVFGDTLTFSYDKDKGGIKNEGNTVLENITNFSITNNLTDQEPGPEMISAVIDGTNRENANILLISYDKSAVLTNASGFTIGNITGINIGFNAFKADAENQTITLTMSRVPMWTEVLANNLTLTYNAAAGTVKDEKGHVGVSAVIPITLQFFTESEYKPPVVKAVTIDGTAQTSLVIEWNKDIAANSGFSGFNISGANPAITFTGSSVNGMTQTLTMSRAPTPAELANLKLSYNSGVGNVNDTNTNRVDSFSNETVIIENRELFLNPPVVQTAVIDVATPTLLVLTFDTPVAITNSTGFSISGSVTANSFLPAVTGSGTTSITFTLNRKPAFSETLLLSYTGAGNALHNANLDVRVAAFTDQIAALNGFTYEHDSRPVLQTIIIDANYDGTEASFEQADSVYLTFDRNVNALNDNGFGITGSNTVTWIKRISGSGTNTLVLTLNNAASESEIANVRLTYDMALGNIMDENNNVVLGFNRNIQFLNYTGMGDAPDREKPFFVSATINHETRSIVQVVFNKQVNIDRTRFVVKVNNVPLKVVSSGAINGIPMDNSARVRTITTATPVGGAPSAVWNLTMSSPAQFGEILRLATAVAEDGVMASSISSVQHLEGAATDVSGNEMLAVTQFIIRNLVQRTRGSFENTPGLYRNGVFVPEVTDGTGGQMYQNAINHLSTSGNYIQNGEVITLVLPGHQTLTTSTSRDNFTSNHLPDTEARKANPPTLIITTPADNTQEYFITVSGNGFGLVIRNALSLVLDENVVFTHSRNVTNSRPLIAMMDGSKMILNGGALRNNLLTADGSFDSGGHRGGAVRVQGGSLGSYLLINSGDISGNTVMEPANATNTGLHGGAGGVTLMQYGVLVMHGGAITNNTYENLSSHSRPRAGGVSDGGGTSNQHHANSAFFMTGGDIGGNTVTGSSTGASAGGVLTSGVFQKNGGTIFGADAANEAMRNRNLMTGANNVRSNAIASIMKAVLNPNLASDPPQARLRDTTTGPFVSLFVESSKAANGSEGVNFVPEWAQSFWDN